MKIWLDDEREAPKDYIWVKTVNDFHDLLKDDEVIEEVSLDNDLGANQKEGYHAITQYIADLLSGSNCKINKFELHTKNIVAREKMLSLINSAKKMNLIDKDVEVEIKY